MRMEKRAYTGIFTAAVLGLFASVVAAAPAVAEEGPYLEGLTLWLKGDDGLATDGSSWTDQSGEHHNATALSGQAPAYVATGLNGLPVASFSGNQAMSIAGSILKGQRFTILAVVTDTSSYVSNYDFREILSNWNTSNEDTSVFLGTIWTNATGRTEDRIRFTDEIGGANQDDSGQGDIAHPTSAFALAGLNSKTNACIHLNTRSEYCLGSALPTRGVGKPWYLGRQGGDSGEYWEGYIAEILVYDRTLSKSELKTDMAYLKAKWGLGSQ